jgi:tetratricopeptide (TPR) repeat protein
MKKRYGISALARRRDRPGYPSPHRSWQPCFFAFLALAYLLFLACVPASMAQTQAARPTQIQEHFRKAAEDLQANDPQSAVKEYDAILALDPKNREALTNRGALEFLRGDCTSASKDLRSALAVAPSLVKATAILGICEKRLGQSSAQPLLEAAYAKLKEKRLRTQVGMELAGTYFQRGDLERAAAVIQSLVDINPDDPNILYMAQLVYSELADETLNKLTIIAPGSARMQQVIAEHLVNAGDLKGAIEHYQKCLEQDPRVPGVRYELAEAILESGPNDPARQAQAQSELSEAVNVEGDNAQIESELGRIDLLQSDPKSAYMHYTRALALNPKEVEAQLGLGHVLLSLGKNEEAIKYLRMAVETDPLNSEAHYRLGTVYRRLGMNDEAAKEMKLFQEIKKTNEQVRLLYRQMNMRPKREEEEISDMSEQQ